MLEYKINGVDIPLLQEEELDNMQSISQLMLLWLELILGPIPIAHNLLSRSGRRQASSSASSKIWELNDISGNISASEGYKRSLSTLRGIEGMLGSLVERFIDMKTFGSLCGSQMVPSTNDAHLRWRVGTILDHARPASSSTPGDPSSEALIGAVVAFTALVLCFDWARHSMTQINGQWVNTAIKTCAAVALQLRGAFGSSASSGCSTVVGVEQISFSSKGCFAGIMNDICIALTIMEGVATTFACLLMQAGAVDVRDTPFAHGREEMGRIILSGEGQNAVIERMGVVLGILCTIMDCLDSMPVGGRRARYIGSVLTRLRTRLEGLDIRADVSFAFEVTQSGSLSVPSQDENNCLKEQASTNSSSNQAMPQRYSHNAEPVPSSFGTSEQSEASSHSPTATLPHPSSAITPYHPSSYDPLCGTQQSLGSVMYGPGPMSMWRSGPCEGEGSSYPPWLFGQSFGDNRGVHPARSTHEWGGTNLLALGWSTPTPTEQPVPSLAHDPNLRRAAPIAAFGHGLLESMPGQVVGRSNLRATHIYASSRVMTMLPDGSSCEYRCHDTTL